MPDKKTKRGVPYRQGKTQDGLVSLALYRVDCAECDNCQVVRVTHSDRVPKLLRKLLWGQRRATHLWICPSCKDQANA